MKISALAAVTLLAACAPEMALAVTTPEAPAEKAERYATASVLSFAGPTLPAEVPTHFVDGDTFDLPIQPFSPTWGRITVRVRVRNINTPETRRPNYKCTAEKILGDRASALTRALLSRDGAHLAVTDRDGLDDYGRVLARVTIDGVDLGEQLIAAGLARPWTDEYQGQTHNYWCGG